jgi:methionyl-tRNA formyltransferase
MRIIFMGTSQLSATVLKGLVGAGYQVVEVYTQPDTPAGRGRRPMPPPVKEAAQELDIPVYQPVSLRRTAELERVRERMPEIIIMAAYGRIVPQGILEVPPLGCLNLHPSLLPRHRGPSPITAAILAGDEETGVSIFQVDAGLDTGPVLAQRRLAIDPSDTGETLSQKLALLGTELLLEVLPRWAAGQIEPVPQDHHQATYSQLLKKQDGRIDWEKPAVEIWRQVRAYQPWPGAYTYWRGKLLKILEAQPIPALVRGEAGRVLLAPSPVGAAARLPAVQTGDGLLLLKRVQLEGRRPLAGHEFLLGERDFVGGHLGT